MAPREFSILKAKPAGREGGGGRERTNFPRMAWTPKCGSVRTARFPTPTSSPWKHSFRRNPKKIFWMRSDGVESIYWAGTESGLMDIYKVPGVIYAAIQWGGIDLLGGHGVRPNGHLQLPWGYHQEITLVCICRLRMCLYVTMTLIDIYISKNFI